MLHHEEAIAAFIRRASVVPDYLAVIVTGSLARGTERPDSDVDLYVIVTEQAFSAAHEEQRLMFTSTEDIGYAGGYFDIKLASIHYLDEAAVRGDDPVRASFEHARVVWSRIDDLGERIERILDVPDAVWESHMASFLAQVRLQGGYFLPQAYEAGNRFLLHNAAVHLAGAACRALLAVNRTLYQGPKYLEKTVASLGSKPAGFEDAVARLLADPSPDTANEVTSALESFHAWPLPPERTLSTFVVDNELAWLFGTLPAEYS